jgi:hypothetical protein
MSHFTRVRTVIRDQPVLEDTLRALNYRFRSGERVPIRGYRGNTEYGQVVVDNGSGYDIGFQRQSDSNFTICADWWGVQGGSALREESFIRDVNRTYAHLTVKRQLERDMFIIEAERVLPNGEIEIIAYERY